MHAEQFEIAGSGTCGSGEADAHYEWRGERWHVSYVSAAGELLGTDRSPGHPAIALLKLEHEARLVDVLMSFLWESEGTLPEALAGVWIA